MERTDIKTIAELRNVSAANAALNLAMARPAHLPGIIALYGPAGWGKSTAAAYCANKTRAYYIACKSVWTRKSLLRAMCKEMCIDPADTLAGMLDQIAEQLVLSRRPLIIDEVDHIVRRNEVELVRDIYEVSLSSIMVIGEEMLPAKLKKTGRFYSRVMHWVQAQPVSDDDASSLAKMYAPKIKFEPDLLRHIVSLAKGSIRRVCVNVELVRAEAAKQGLDTIGLTKWGKREFYTGEAPERGNDASRYCSSFFVDDRRLGVGLPRGMDILIGVGSAAAVLVPALRLTWLCLPILWHLAVDHWLGQSFRRYTYFATPLETLLA